MRGFVSVLGVGINPTRREWLTRCWFTPSSVSTQHLQTTVQQVVFLPSKPFYQPPYHGTNEYSHFIITILSIIGLLVTTCTIRLLLHYNVHTASYSGIRISALLEFMYKFYKSFWMYKVLIYVLIGGKMTASFISISL